MTRAPGYVKTWTCLCGWFRCFDTRPAKMAKIVPHPVYGIVTAIDCARLDVKYHNCTDHVAALRRARERSTSALAG